MQNAAMSVLQKENGEQRAELQKLQNAMKKVFTEDQAKLLQGQHISKWSFKVRYALSVRGFKHLRNTGYPLPSYCTLMRRIQSLTVSFGIFDDVLDLLRF